MNWTNWEPNLRANLLFLQRGDEVLLIRKKRGIGAGKINAPGGKIEPGEMWEDDIHWLPKMLEGQTFKGYFEFDDDKMLSKALEFFSGKLPSA